jgi:hypothetical protein
MKKEKPICQRCFQVFKRRVTLGNPISKKYNMCMECLKFINSIAGEEFQKRGIKLIKK